MYFQYLVALATVYPASAFPAMAAKAVEIPQHHVLPRTLPLSANEGNSGPIPSLVFSAADQLVDVGPGSGHVFIAPKSTDRRGPCPGLNAAANHGFIPRNGILTVTQAVSGMSQLFNMDVELSAALAAIGIAFGGDPIARTWSIGGPYQGITLGGLLSSPKGISFSHNNYESDAYLNNGNAYSLNMERFKQLYFSATSFTPDVLREHSKYVHEYSIKNNPYFFAGSGAVALAPTVPQFIINFMSNHSADNFNGYLDRNILKSFYAVSGPDEALVYHPGQEQVPNNFYKRPSSNMYSVVTLAADLAISAIKTPEIFVIGGNTGTVNSFVGVNPSDLTGGVYTAQTLLQGNNLGCFLFQALQQDTPQFLSGLISNLGPVVALVNSVISPLLQTLNCPALNTFDQSYFNQFPGVGYHPSP